jgi:hypothetical protein
VALYIVAFVNLAFEIYCQLLLSLTFTSCFVASSAKFADPGAGDISRHGVASVWAAIAMDDDEEEAKEETAAPAAAASASGSAAPTASARAKPAAAAATIATTAAECLQGVGEALTTEADVKEACVSIVDELRSSLDSDEALRRAGDLCCAPLELRERLIETILQVGKRMGRQSSR